MFTLTNTIKHSISEAVVSWCVESHIKVPVYMMVLLGMNSFLLYALWNSFLPLFCVFFLVLSNLTLANIDLGMAYVIKDFRKHQ